MKERKKPEKFLLPHGMPSDEREFAFSSRVPPKALKIKAPYKSWHYQNQELETLATCTNLLNCYVVLLLPCESCGINVEELKRVPYEVGTLVGFCCPN